VENGTTENVRLLQPCFSHLLLATGVLEGEAGDGSCCSEEETRVMVAVFDVA